MLNKLFLNRLRAVSFYLSYIGETMSAKTKSTPLTEGHVAIIRLLARQGVAFYLQQEKEAPRELRHLRPV